MSTRHSLPMTLAAVAVVVGAAGAAAVEATAWTPETEAMASRNNTDGTLEPLAWATRRGEATEFHDSVSRDSVRTPATGGAADLIRLASLISRDDPIAGIAALVTDAPVGTAGTDVATPLALAEDKTVEVH